MVLLDSQAILLSPKEVNQKGTRTSTHHCASDWDPVWSILKQTSTDFILTEMQVKWVPRSGFAKAERVQPPQTLHFKHPCPNSSLTPHLQEDRLGKISSNPLKRSVFTIPHGISHPVSPPALSEPPGYCHTCFPHLSLHISMLSKILAPGPSARVAAAPTAPSHCSIPALLWDSSATEQCHSPVALSWGRWSLLRLPQKLQPHLAWLQNAHQTAPAAIILTLTPQPCTKLHQLLSRVSITLSSPFFLSLTQAPLSLWDGWTPPSPCSRAPWVSRAGRRSVTSTRASHASRNICEQLLSPQRPDLKSQPHFSQADAGLEDLLWGYSRYILLPPARSNTYLAYRLQCKHHPRASSADKYILPSLLNHYLLSLTLYVL